jgi:predicted Zn-dependent protease
MANKEGNAAMVFRLAPGNSLREAAQQTLTKNNLTAVESKEVNVNGYSALAVVADQQPQQQQMQQQQQAPPIRVLAYFIQDSQTIYNFLGYAAQPDFQQYYPTFNSVISNFRELTDPTKLNRKPDRVRVKPVAQNGTLQQAFQQLNVPTKQMQELALLNGMELNETVQKGTLVKVIESGNPALSRR